MTLSSTENTNDQLKAAEAEHTAMKRALNKEQKKALSYALKGDNLFISGGAGTGKSFLLRVIAWELRERRKEVVVTAPTGIAAAAVDGATLHHTFGLPVDLFTEKKGKLKVRVPKEILQMDVLIVDEISMVRMDLFDAVIQCVRGIQNKSGKEIQIILIGDFYQLPPVVNAKHGDDIALQAYYHRNVGNAYAFQADSWDSLNLRPILLRQIVRQQNQEFASHLNRLREGDDTTIDYFNSHSVPQPLRNVPSLYCYNAAVETKNMAELAKLPGEPIPLEADVHLMKGAAPLTDEEKKEVPHEISLKPGAKVVITENALDGLYHNGTCAIFNEYDAKYDCLIVTLLGQDGSERERTILYKCSFPIYKYVIQDGHIQRKTVATVVQFPVRLAYALTVHRGQGQTYDAVNVQPNCFSPGQLYVALSRVRDIDHMHIQGRIKTSDLIVDKAVKDFYENLAHPAKKMGRPLKYGEETVVINIPVKLLKHMKQERDAGKPLPMKYVPQYSAKRTQLCVPASMKAYFLKERDDWKKAVKPRKKDKGERNESTENRV